MLATAIARKLEQRGRRRAAGERTVVADVDPQPALVGLALGQHRTGVSSPCRRSAASTWAAISACGASATAHAPTWSASVDRLRSTPRGIAPGLPVERLMLTELLEQDHRQRARARPAARRRVEGAGGWVIRSQSRQVNFSRTVWTTFHWRGTTSSVSVTSSPSFAIRPEPQQQPQVAALRSPRSRGRCSGNGLRTGRRA